MNTVSGPASHLTAKQENPADDNAGRGGPVSPDFRWLVFVALATALLCLPFLRTIYAASDEGVLLNGADRILRGDRLYTDFFEFIPPGGFVVVAAWLGIAGSSMVSARILASLVIVAIACFTYMTCRLVSKSAFGSSLLVLGWVAMSQGVGTQVSYHWFTTLFATICAWASISYIRYPERWLRWPLIAGTAAGAAGMVMPPQGALAMLAAMTGFLHGPRYKQRLGLFLLATALVPVGLLLYLLWLGALTAAFDDVIVFTATRYAGVQAVPFARWAGLQDLPLAFSFPVAGLLTVLAFARDWRNAFHDRIFRTCIAFGVAGVVDSFPRPDIGHIAFAVPLVCPLIICSMHRLTDRWLPIYRYGLAAAMIAASVPAVRSYSWAVQKALHGQVVSTPRGDVIFTVPGARELVARIASTPSGARYFFYPTEELLPFLTARPQVGRFDRLMPNYNTPTQYLDTCLSVMRDAQWLVFANLDAAGWRAVYPAMSDPDTKERLQFERVLTSASEFVERDGWFELRRRVPGLDESACSTIVH